MTIERLRMAARLARLEPQDALLRDCVEVLSLLRALDDLDPAPLPQAHRAFAELRDETVGSSYLRDVLLREITRVTDKGFVAPGTLR